MGRDARKPVFRVSDKARLKAVSSATETSQETEIWLVASLDMILFKKANNNKFSIPHKNNKPRRQVFSRQDPKNDMCKHNVRPRTG